MGVRIDRAGPPAPPSHRPRRPARRVAGLLAGLLLAACSDPEPGPPSALLITLDTTRADVLEPYGGAPGLTPAIEQLAREGVVFERAYATSPLTLPSHGSMLTGLWPPVHGLRENGLNPLPRAAETVAERARAHGLQTAAFVAAQVLDAQFGLDQGFETYVGPARADGGATSHALELRGDVVVDRALAWLAGRDRERPFFAWVHLFDPHGPYAPPAPYRRGGNDPKALYEGEVAFADAQVGRLLAALRGDGTLDGTWVVLVGDHGEAFGEHGEPTHGAYVWDTTLQVPLILRYPDRSRAGERVGMLASVADVGPTLVEALGLGPLQRSDGASLLAPWPADEAEARGVYFESYSGYLSYGWSPLAGWRDARGKYVHSSRPQLFDTEADPDESLDLLAPGPARVDAQRLRPYREALAAVGELVPLEADEQAGPSHELLGQIQALGYAGAGGAATDLPPPLSTTALPAPQDCVTIYSEGLRAQELLNLGRTQEAAEVLAPLLDAQPDNPFLLDRLGRALIALQREEEGIALLERLLQVGPAWPGSLCNLGLAYYRIGRVDEAVTRLQQAVEGDPGEPFFWDALLEVLAGSGRSAEHAEWSARRAALGGG